MRLREIFKEMAKTHLTRLLHKPGYDSRIREKLGDSVDLLTYQRPLLGALILAESMGSVLFEAGKHAGTELTEGGMPTLEKLPGYRDFAESKNLEDARLSTGYLVLQMVFKETGTGLIKLTEFKKDKLYVYQVEECSDCWGIKDLNKSVCHFIGGVIAGALEYSLKKTVGFAETMCRAKGDSCCEFKYTIIKEKEQ
jgi:predicted hydrocarbon binding protein